MTAVLDNALGLVYDEVRRQAQLKAEGRFRYTPADPNVTEMAKLAMLTEEVGEVGRNLMARAGMVADGDTSTGALVKELTQVAAIAVAWLTVYQPRP